MAPRWCICAGARAVRLPFAVDVLMHNGEAWKPSGTGNLIRRIVTGARRHMYHNQIPPRREDVYPAASGDGGAGRTTWILHPRGDALADVVRDGDSHGGPLALENLQVLLIDGTWAQATDMLRHAGGWGRKVSLPASALPGGSRYWLRAQHHPAHFSTIEALMGLLNALGCGRECVALREQFELHVYASLLARGHKTRAGQFLADSPIKNSMPGLVQTLQTGAE
jgi:DTW domain-containing protein YfiP